MSRKKPARRERTPEIDAAAKLVNVYPHHGATTQHANDYALVVERAQSDPHGMCAADYVKHDGYKLTEAQRAAERMFKLSRRASAAMDGWETQQVWATDERVLADFKKFGSFVTERATAIRNKGGMLEAAVAGFGPEAMAPLVLKLREAVAAAEVFRAWTRTTLDEFEAKAPPWSNVGQMAFYAFDHVLRVNEHLRLISREAQAEYLEQPIESRLLRAAHCIDAYVAHMAGAPTEIISARRDAKRWADMASGNVVSLDDERARRALMELH